MKHQIATDPSQSKRLHACGLNNKTADMTLSFCNNNFYELMATPFHYGCFNEKDAPAWSLSALLELLPRKINDHDLETTLVLSPSRYSKGWIIEYIDGDVSDTLHSFRGFSLIEGCVLMIEWLAANGYTLNTK